jgi:tetratricopeptide (TPR) repeat protein
MTHDPLQKAAMTAQIGYWYQAQKADTKAIEAFKEAVSLQKSAAYYKALGYSQMRLHHRDNAVASFKNAIDLMPASDLNQTALYEMKRNITYLQKRFFGYFAMIGGNQVKKSISPIADNKTGGFAALRLGYRPLTSTDRLEVYLDAAVGIRNNSFATNDESFQPGVGLAYRVTSDGHIVVSVTQLFKTGKRSRNDTMLRLSGKFFDDYTYHPDTAGRWYKSLYADLAYYLNYESYRLYAKYEQGYMFKPDQHTSLMPYAMTSVAYNNDNKAKKTMYNYDAGVGLSYLFWLGETRYTMPAYTGRVGLEARKSYNTNYDKDTELDMMIELLF